VLCDLYGLLLVQFLVGVYFAGLTFNIFGFDQSSNLGNDKMKQMYTFTKLLLAVVICFIKLN